MLKCNIFSERLRLDKLQGHLDTELSSEFKDVSHPHNAYNLIKYWKNALDFTRSGTTTEEMQDLLETNGITLPTANDIIGNG